MKIPEILCKDTILKYVDELSIFTKYLGYEPQVGKYYLSPFRKEETPSFNVYHNKYNDRLWFKDYGDSSGFSSGDCFRLVEKLYSCDFKAVLHIIDTDFNLNISSALTDYQRKALEVKKKEKKEFQIDVKVQAYTEADIEYYAQYYLDINYLKFFETYSIKHIWINKGRIFNWDYTYENPVHGYYYQKKFKLYRPNETNKKEKWKSNLLPEHWLGLKQLPEKGDLLIIVKSYKDVKVLRRLGIAAVSPPGETTVFPKVIIENLKSRFKTIIIWYDNDDTGIEYANLRAEEHALSYVHNPIGEPKDPSDFIKEYGVKETENLVNELGVWN